MREHLEQQLVNELCAKLQEINETYKGFFHVRLFTLVDAKEDSCDQCKESQFQCLRCVLGVTEGAQEAAE